jgi:type II secretion system protein N
MLRRLFTVIFYCLFILVVGGVFLVLLFPQQKFLGWSARLIERKVPGVECSIGGIRYVHPLKIRLYEIFIKHERYLLELPIDTLLVSFAPEYPLKQIGLTGVLLGGSLDVDIRLDSPGRLDLESIEFSGMHLDELAMVENIIDRPARGKLYAVGRAAIERQKPFNLSFVGRAEIEDFQAPLRRPVLGETEIRFDSLKSDLTLEGGRLELSLGRAAGPLLAGDFWGQIRWSGFLQQSTLDISGNLVPGPDLSEKHPEGADQVGLFYARSGSKSIPFIIEGTLAEPQFRFSDSGFPR